jgi:hypothetical protein
MPLHSGPWARYFPSAALMRRLLLINDSAADYLSLERHHALLRIRSLLQHENSNIIALIERCCLLSCLYPATAALRARD